MVVRGTLGWDSSSYCAPCPYVSGREIDDMDPNLCLSTTIFVKQAEVCQVVGV